MHSAKATFKKLMQMTDIRDLGRCSRRKCERAERFFSEHCASFSCSI